jgi:hypothetical protein
LARIREIVFDCHHPAALARVWAAALDGYAVRAYDDIEIARLSALGFTPETDPSVMVDGPGPHLCFQKMSRAGAARGRVHIDIVGAEREAEVARLVALGARIRDEHETYTVMLDPEGNAFCVQVPGA